MSQQLSDDLARQIEYEAETYGQDAGERITKVHEYFTHADHEAGYIKGATTYALLLEDAERRNKEYSALLTPLLEYGQSAAAKIPLWASITAVILERAKHCEQLAAALEFIEKKCKEAGLEKVAIDNLVHMAIYHSIHASNQALSNYNQLIKKV